MGLSKALAQRKQNPDPGSQPKGGKTCPRSRSPVPPPLRAHPPMPPGGSRPQRTFSRHRFGFFRNAWELHGLGENSVGFPSIRNGLAAPGFQIRCL